jgi:hypothetical protein
MQAARRKFSQQLKTEINESMVRLFKKQYRMELRAQAEIEEGEPKFLSYA